MSGARLMACWPNTSALAASLYKQNAQRLLLRPLVVPTPSRAIPQFPGIGPHCARGAITKSTSRFIDTIAFLHQYQRPIKTASRGTQQLEYIEVTLADIKAANAIAHEVLGQFG
ncbi:MAG: hypothetical protein IPL70_16020 [Uliginosibacterium sp.]|nr:hypothetical protein [Uliginosibacterium sp.]